LCFGSESIDPTLGQYHQARAPIAVDPAAHQLRFCNLPRPVLPGTAAVIYSRPGEPIGIPCNKRSTSDETNRCHSGQSNWGRAYAVFVLYTMIAIVLPDQTFTTLHSKCGIPSHCRSSAAYTRWDRRRGYRTTGSTRRQCVLPQASLLSGRNAARDSCWSSRCSPLRCPTLAHARQACISRLAKGIHPRSIACGKLLSPPPSMPDLRELPGARPILEAFLSIIEASAVSMRRIRRGCNNERSQRFSSWQWRQWITACWCRHWVPGIQRMKSAKSIGVRMGTGRPRSKPRRCSTRQISLR